MALISGGQLVALGGRRNQSTERPVRLDSGLALWGGRSADYAVLWREQPHIRTVIDFLARSVSQLGLHAFERGKDGDRVKVDRSSNLGELTEVPAPNLTMLKWLDRCVHDMAIYDRFLAVKAKDRFGRVWVQPVPVDMWRPLQKDWTGPSGYMVGESVLRPDEVVVMFGYAPDSLSHGTPPMEALRQLLASYAAAEESQEAFWAAGAQIRGIIERPVNAPPISDAGMERLRQDWDGRYSGRQSAGRTPILEDGMTFKGVSSTAKDAEYLGSRKLTREEVAAAFHVPAPFVGILEHATFSNIREQHKQLYADTLGPWLRLIEGELERQLVEPEFGDKFFLDFNEADRLRGSFEERAAVMSTAIGGPWMTRNEARRLENLPRIDDPEVDSLITPLNVTSGGQASPQSGKSAELREKAKKETVIPVERSEDDATAIDEALTAHAGRLAKSVASALGKKSVDASGVVDRERWDSELAADLLPLLAAIAERAGQPIADVLEIEGWSPDVMAAWLDEKATGTAEALNDGLVALLDSVDVADGQTIEAALSEASGGWDTATIAGVMALGLAGWAAVDAAKRSPKTMKRWIVRHPRPRKSCQSTNGETVPVDGVFSNGLKWPGDGIGSADLTAGCTCDMEIVRTS